MEHRVLLCTVTTRDAIVAVAVLQRSGIEALACDNFETLIQEMDKGVGAVLLSEEILNRTNRAHLMEWLQGQPAWSDLPVFISARPGIDTTALEHAFELLSNVTVLERPMRIASLVSAARSALRARERQFQLREHLEVLHDADRRKTEFLATLAHELRNPMAPLTTALAILRIKAPLPVGMKPYYDLMGRQVEHMAKLVDDLMEVSRITRGKIALKQERVFISSVIGDAIEVSRPGIEAHFHELIVKPIDPLLAVHGDSVRLTQVFSNLLNNAARYTADRGHIYLEVHENEHSLDVIIRDTGIGISVKDLRVIFDMFVQVAGTARAAQGGLGIGLTLVKSLVELHGGKVQAESVGLGHGSEFRVSLPLAKRSGHASLKENVESSEVSEAEKMFQGITILVVDDNRDAADSLAELLLIHGAKVEVAYSGESGLASFRVSPPQMAILDIGMPLMDGYELAKKIVQESNQSIPFLVALTGWGQVEDRAQIIAAGFKMHLIKPLNFAELAACSKQIRLQLTL